MESLAAHCSITRLKINLYGCMWKTNHIREKWLHLSFLMRFIPQPYKQQKNGETKKFHMLHLTSINNQEFYCELLHYSVKSYDSTKAN